MQPKVLDLFSGIMGFSMAFEAEGFRTTAFCEIDPDASTVIKSHYPNVPNYGDITKLVRTTKELKAFRQQHGHIAVLCGGVPCQPASLAGMRKGTKDERWLWPEVVRVAGKLLPDFCLFENPSALLTLDKGRAFLGILDSLAAIGYDCWWDCLRASDVGAGHKRERMFLLAAHTSGFRLEAGGRAHKIETIQRTHKERPISAPRVFNPERKSRDWFKTQSPVESLVHGLPGKLAESALRCVGNSVVPQVVQIYAKALRKMYA